MNNINSIHKKKSEKDKITLKISCGIEHNVDNLSIIFSINNGRSWFLIEMIKNQENFEIIIPSVPIEIDFIYLLKAKSKNKEYFIEKNKNILFKERIIKEEIKENIDIEKSELKNIEDNSSNSNLPPEFLQNVNPFLNRKESPNENNIKKEEGGALPHDISLVDHFKKNHDEMDESEIETRRIDSSSKTPQPPELDILPIIAYNPYSENDGNIQIRNDPHTLFSEIIDEQVSNNSQHSSLKLSNSKLIDIVPCRKCASKIQSKWLICPFCGQKIK